jgi:hypothetical protein
MKDTFTSLRRKHIRPSTQRELERISRGENPLDCYEQDEEESCCAVAGVMTYVCRRCPWARWTAGIRYRRVS